MYAWYVFDECLTSYAIAIYTLNEFDELLTTARQALVELLLLPGVFPTLRAVCSLADFPASNFEKRLIFDEALWLYESYTEVGFHGTHARLG